MSENAIKAMDNIGQPIAGASVHGTVYTKVPIPGLFIFVRGPDQTFSGMTDQNGLCMLPNNCLLALTGVDITVTKGLFYGEKKLGGPIGVGFILDGLKPLGVIPVTCTKQPVATIGHQTAGALNKIGDAIMKNVIAVAMLIGLGAVMLYCIGRLRGKSNADILQMVNPMDKLKSVKRWFSK